MRVSIILLAVTAAVLASASGASTFHLSKTASTDLEHSMLLLSLLSNPSVNRTTKREQSELVSEMLAGIKAVFNKVDDMDLKAANMIKGKTPEEAEEVYLKLVDGILPLLQGMERQGISPTNTKEPRQIQRTVEKRRKILQQFSKRIGDFPRMKNVET
ncbi:hypothetical protein GQ600_15118 [Phytophthora cactorum]|nr:hypothetical protein GQ600_15118 [Phytophthora cactorum]